MVNSSQDSSMSVLAVIVALVMAAVLLWAGLEKLVDLPAVGSTINALGVPVGWANRVSALVPLAEVVTGLSLLFAPGSPWTQGGLVALGGTFAVAGLIAIFRDEPIRCHCFGSRGAGGYLGRSQVVALVAWIGGAWVLQIWMVVPVSTETGAARFAAVGLAIATWKATALWRAVREARGDRASAQEMYVWLPQR
jgi:hypothetical protein